MSLAGVVLLLVGQCFQWNIGFIGNVQFRDGRRHVVFGRDMEKSRDGVVHSVQWEDDGGVWREDVRGGKWADGGDEKVVL